MSNKISITKIPREELLWLEMILDRYAVDNNNNLVWEIDNDMAPIVIECARELMINIQTKLLGSDNQYYRLSLDRKNSHLLLDAVLHYNRNECHYTEKYKDILSRHCPSIARDTTRIRHYVSPSPYQQYLDQQESDKSQLLTSRNNLLIS